MTRPTFIAELLEAAGKATPGPWFAADWQQDEGENTFTVESRSIEILRPWQSSIWPDGIRKQRIAVTEEGENPIEDAAYIAIANPANILELARYIKELEAGRDAADVYDLNGR